jgi:hypothetical protein
MDATLKTPFEQGNGNQTTTLAACIAFYQDLAQRYPRVLKFWAIGQSDAGVPLYAGLVSADGVFNRAEIRRAGRTVFFNNNGIHPGEPEGIDACMALVRDFCVEPERLAALGDTVFLFIPVYNVDGCLNRSTTSRVSQIGPEQFGFRGNSRHLDLNRDFIKADSLCTRAFIRLFQDWDPDMMVDTHTSNGADYAYTMTLIPTQPDKLGGGLGEFLRATLRPQIDAQMIARGWPTCPYVNPVKLTPDDGIADFLETPRFSTGYAALHHTIGFMPETHMLKPFADRYASMRALVESVLALTVEHADTLRALRRAARLQATQATEWPVYWEIDDSRSTPFLFNGYAAVYRPSLLGDYTRLAYDRNQPWTREIACYDRYRVRHVVRAPQAYVIPQAWREAVERLAWNGVQMERIVEDTVVQAQCYRIASVTSRSGPFEGRMLYDDLALQAETGSFTLRAGDYRIPLQQDKARYIVETLEPMAHDSLLRWGFFNGVLQKKEGYSDYAFEDTALTLLQEEPALQAKFEQWKREHPELLKDQARVLDFIYENCAAHAEPEWRRYPVLSVFA